MATILEFPAVEAEPMQPESPASRVYNVEVSAYPDDYIEFTAHGVKTDTESLYRIAAELEKIASIIYSDLITRAAHTPA